MLCFNLELFAPARSTHTTRCLLNFRADSMTQPSLPVKVPFLVKNSKLFISSDYILIPSSFKKKYIFLEADIGWNKFSP